MRALRLMLAVLIAASAFAGVVWWFGPRLPAPARSPAPPAAPAPAPTAPPSQPALPAPAPAAPSAVPEPADAEPPAAARSGDLAIYDRKPMSAVPHQVARAWGLSEDARQRGMIGAYLVVEPGISDAQLLQLGRDLLEYHRAAKIVAVRIYDSEQAASYDRETDGGVLAERHLIARVVNDPARGLRGMYLRGKWLEL